MQSRDESSRIKVFGAKLGATLNVVTAFLLPFMQACSSVTVKSEMGVL
jgi:hypothetical protein